MRGLKTNKIVIIALAILIPFLIVNDIYAQSFDLTPVADKTTMIPDGTGTFTRFFPPVPIGGDDVAFLAEGASDQEGIYTFISSTLAVVVDTGTAIPGGTGNFTGFGFPAPLGGADFAFLGFGSSGQEGIYTVIGGSLSVVADLTTSIPGGTGTFTDFSSPVPLSGKDFAFNAEGASGQEGIYTFISSTLAAAVDTSTNIPGGTGTFTSFSSAPQSLGGADFVFRGFGAGQEGIYTIISNTLAAVADFGTSIPGGTGDFTDFPSQPIAIGGKDVAFKATGAGQEGIYTFISSTLAEVADTGTMIPGGTGTFTGVSDLVSLGGGDVMFVGSGSSSQVGIYTSIGGILAVLVDTSDMVPGGGVAGNFSDFEQPVPLGGGDIAFQGIDSILRRANYAIVDGTVLIIANQSTMVPGGTGTFTGIGFPKPLGNGNISFNALGTSSQAGIYTTATRQTTLTIVKEALFADGIDFGFTGTNFPSGCDMDGTFTLNDEESVACDLDPGTYTVQETNSQGFNITDIDCEGASDFSTTADSVTINLLEGENAVCEFRNFRPDVDILTIDLAGTGEGNVSAPGIDCGDGGMDCIESYPDGTEVTLVATPAVGSIFVGFSGDPDCTDGMVTLTSDTNCIATFDLIVASSLTIVKQSDPAGATGFEFTGVPFPVDCPLRGDFMLDDGGSLSCDLSAGSYTVRETNSQGFTISDIDCEGASDFTTAFDRVTVNLVDDEDVVCTFTNTNVPVSPTLDINLAGTGTGNVTAPGIDCGNGGIDCMETYMLGDEVTLTATPNGGSNFVGYTGDPDCDDGMVTMDEDISCTATFDLNTTTFDLNINLEGTGEGKVTATGIDCGDGGADCMESYPDGTEVTLMATPVGGSTFAGFTGDPDCTDGMVTVDSNLTCTATFDLNTTTFDLEIELAGTGTGNVSATGIDCGIGGTDCMESYPEGTEVTLTAISNPGSTFAGYTGDPDCGDGMVTVDSNITCTATFNLNTTTFDLNINLAGTGTGNVSASGIDCGNGGTDCMESYPEGTEVALTATPSPGSTFAGYTGDPDCGDGMVTVDSNISCTATFNLNTTTFDLDINLAGTGTGNVSASGIDCGDGGADCMETYPEGTEVTLMATPKGGSTFTGFSGDPDCDDGMVTVDSNITCTATFDLNTTTFNLNINLDGTGEGNVTATGIDCGDGGADCMENYPDGTVVTLTATPNPGSSFSGYTGDPDCGDGMVTVDANKSCTATFIITPDNTLSINLAGTGIGNVSASGIDCGDGGADCMETYESGTEVTLLATPDASSIFIGFTGDPDCADGMVTMDSNTSCTAIFDIKRFTLNVAKIGTGTGTVTSAPGGINCGGDCSQVYDLNTVVTLTPVNGPASNFGGWTGDPDCDDGSVTMDSDKICTAVFNSTAPPPTSADVSVVKTGAPDPVEAGSELTYNFEVNNSGPNAVAGVVLTDILPQGVEFVSASPGCENVDGTVSCSFGTLSNGETQAVSIIVAALEIGSITNSVTVNSPATDPNNSNNTSTTTTEVVGDINEVLSVESDIETITTGPGAMVSIPVEISNSSTAQTRSLIQTRQTVEGVQFTVNLPGGFDAEELITTQGSCNTELLECDLGDIGPGETVTVVVDAIAPEEDGVFLVTFRASTSSGQEFSGNASVRVGSGDGEGSGGGCALASTGTERSDLLALAAPFMALMLFVGIRRKRRGNMN